MLIAFMQHVSSLEAPVWLREAMERPVIDCRGVAPASKLLEEISDTDEAKE